MGIKKASSTTSYFELLEPITAQKWRSEANCSEQRRPRGTDRYWTGRRWSTTNTGGVTPAQVEMALALCEICPVQWECVTMAVVEKQHFSIWAVDVEDRRLLRGGDRLELVAQAKAEGRSVRSVVIALRPHAE